MKVKDLLSKFDPASVCKYVEIVEQDGIMWDMVGSLDMADIECKAYAKYGNRTVIAFRTIHYTKPKDEYIFRIYTKPEK